MRTQAIAQKNFFLFLFVVCTTPRTVSLLAMEEMQEMQEVVWQNGAHESGQNLTILGTLGDQEPETAEEHLMDVTQQSAYELYMNLCEETSLLLEKKETHAIDEAPEPPQSEPGPENDQPTQEIPQTPVTPSKPVHPWQKEIDFTVTMLVMERNALNNLGGKNEALKRYLFAQRNAKKKECLDYFSYLNCLGLEEQSRKKRPPR